MSSDKVSLSKDKLFHFKIGNTSTVQCLHLHTRSMVVENQNQNWLKLPVMVHIFVYCAPGWDLPEELLCSVEQHWHGYPTGNVKKVKCKELKDSPIEPPESGKQLNCCSTMCVTSTPQQGLRLPGSCWPFHHRNFSTLKCWCCSSLPDFFLLLLSFPPFLSPQLPAQPICIILRIKS